MRRRLALGFLFVGCALVDNSTTTNADAGLPNSSAGASATGGQSSAIGGSSILVNTGGSPVPQGGMLAVAGNSSTVGTASGGQAAAGGYTSTGGTSGGYTAAGGYPALDTGGNAGWDGGVIYDVPLSCSDFSPSVCGYVSDGLGGVLFCRPCPPCVPQPTCEQVCTSSLGGIPSCVSDLEPGTGYVVQCQQPSGCADLSVLNCWCPVG